MSQRPIILSTADHAVRRPGHGVISFVIVQTGQAFSKGVYDAPGCELRRRALIFWRRSLRLPSSHRSSRIPQAKVFVGLAAASMHWT
jgi:hypothetical protein